MTDLEELQKQLEAIREELKTLSPGSHAHQRLREEQAALGARLSGAGAIAQGDGATAVGENGISVGGNLSGTLVTGEQNQVIQNSTVIMAEAGAQIVIGAPAEAAGGLVALRELMQRSSDVRTAVVAFQTDFKVAHEQVDRLGDYKDLHDLLHRLQFYCYNGIVQAALRFPTDELTLDNLTDYALTLEGIIDELKQVAARPSLPKQELSWIDDVSLTKADLRAAIDSLDEKSLKKVIWRLNRLLAIQPARINTLLNNAARALRLPALTSTLARVCDDLTSPDLDTDKVAAFRSGVKALGELDHALSALIDDHDGWQVLDVELRRIEASIDHDLNELEMSWADIKPKAESLYIAYPDEWAGALKKESDVLEEALSSNNPAKVRRSFRSYQRRAADRFYRVDIELKTLCGSLRQVGTPLASVLRMIE